MLTYFSEKLQPVQIRNFLGQKFRNVIIKWNSEHVGVIGARVQTFSSLLMDHTDIIQCFSAALIMHEGNSSSIRAHRLC